MPRLIHLNGTPGVGKSTIAELYADRHPGVLNLDTDRVVSMIGGWRDDFRKTVKAARILAISMAETHLRTGHDVVMPQLIARLDEAARFEAACDRGGAEYCEIALIADKPSALERFTGRAAGDDRAPHRYIDQIVERSGGPVFLERIRDHFTAYLRGRPDCMVLSTEGRSPAQTYDAVTALLAGVG